MADSVKITFWGGAQTVTGSTHLVETNQSRVLIDAGLFQGRRDDFYRVNNTFPLPPPEIDTLLLSHAHIDHSGNIPNLVKHGLTAPIYATTATVDLCRLMLLDSGHIQEEDIKFVNKINKRKGLPFREPLYTQSEAQAALESFRGVEYQKAMRIRPDVISTFYDSGHVLGSAIVVLDFPTTNGTARLGYAVDLGRKDLPLLRDPVVPPGLDYLIIESTYGDRLHDPIDTATNKLADAVNRTVKRDGKVIIPSFAFERTQEVIYFLNELISKRAIPKLPIFVDSPLATDITGVFQHHPDYLDETVRQMLRKHLDPFGLGIVDYLRTTEESKRLNEDRRPMIIIAASGMCEAGRILHHLKNNIENQANTILVVGYMAENTLGKRIVERQPVVKIFGEGYHLNAEVVKINAFSAHADKAELTEFIRRCGPQLKRIFLVHGDPDQAEPFLNSLQESHLPAYLPQKGETITLS